MMKLNFEELMLIRHLVIRELEESHNELKEEIYNMLLDILRKINEMTNDDVFRLVDGDKE